MFAKNKLVIVTKPGNPKNVKSLADLATVGIVSLCGETVPCGKYADQVLTSAGVTIPADKITRGVDVKATLAAVTTGDADAAIVYVTDAKTGRLGRHRGARSPTSRTRSRRIRSWCSKSSNNQATAQAFVKYVSGPQGRGHAEVVWLPPADVMPLVPTVVHRRGR